MRKTFVGLATLLAGALAASSADAQQTLKIGVVMSYSGQFADPGAQIDNGIKLYMKQNGDTVAGKKIELIRKDTGGIAPDVAKRLSQEVIVRDGADILAGYDLTPERARRRRRLGAGQEVHGQHERRDLGHHHQVALHGAHLVHRVRSSTRRSAPGPTRTACARPTRWSPTSARATTAKPRSARASRTPAARSSARRAIRSPTIDFTAFLQRAKDANPDGIYIWVPGGPQPAAIGKAIAERGIDKSKVKIMGQGELTYRGRAQEHGRRRPRPDHRLPLRLQSPVGEEQGVRRGLQRRVQAQSRHVLGRRLRRHAPDLRGAEEDQRQHRRRGADRRRQGHDVGEPARADDRSIRRRATWSQTVYIRRVEKVGGQLVNVEFDKIENVKDPWKARHAEVRRRLDADRRPGGRPR